MLPNTNIGRLILESVASESSTVKTASSKYGAKDATKISQGLVKIASVPYNEGVYSNVKEMIKIAAECMEDIGGRLDSEHIKLANLEKAAEVRILLEDMINNGMVNEDNIEEKVAELIKKDKKDLSIIKEAVKLTNNKEGANIFFEASQSPGSEGAVRHGIFDSVSMG